MNTPHVVIGAGYGDESKGLITDYLASTHGADLVVRFNGGAQAGHTVQTPSGERHVFSHFGSGSFVGASTFLSKHFIINPIAFIKETDALLNSWMRSNPVVYVDGEAIVTTPYDMLINQLLENDRAGNRHGSCGLGINETVVRSNHPEFRLTYEDLHDTKKLTDILVRIRTLWYPYRCAVLGIDQHAGAEIITNKNVFDNFIYDSNTMTSLCHMESPYIINNANQVIFEGAQGLLLDEKNGDFPHVTRSRTGLHNVVDILNSIGWFDEINVTYVTRCYLTRHGSGPLNNELKKLPYPKIVDNTNIPNEFQGSLRFAYLDLDRLSNAIKTDLKEASTFKVNSRLAITCLDQLDYEAKVYHNNSLQTLRDDAYSGVGDLINAMVDGKVKLTEAPLKSFGPTRSTIK